MRDRCVALDRYHRAILSLSDKPLVAQPVTLTLHFRFLDDAPEARAWFDLPEGIALLDGSLAWQGSLRSGDEGVLAVEIQVARPGYYQLKGIAQAETTAHGFEVRDTLDVEVTTNDAILGSKPENLWYDPDNPLAFPAVLDHELVEGHMALTPKPALNQVLTLTYRITPWVDLADPARNYMTLELPPRAFEIVDVKFPEGGRPTRTSSPGAAASKRATRLSSRWPLR